MIINFKSCIKLSLNIHNELLNIYYIYTIPYHSNMTYHTIRYGFFNFIKDYNIHCIYNIILDFYKKIERK
jgi:hypothetical protein